MKRQTYIYWAVPLFTLLGCGGAFESLFGPLGMLVAGSLLTLLTWGVVWMRLYTAQLARPEFAVLAILPQLLYFVMVAMGETGAGTPFSAPAWQNLYFLLFVAAMVMQSLSFRAAPGDETSKSPKDRVFLILTVLIIANGLLSWAHYAARLFPIS